MKKTSNILVLSLLTMASLQAATVFTPLNLIGGPSGTISTTSFTTSSGATFDINITLSATSSTTTVDVTDPANPITTVLPNVVSDIAINGNGIGVVSAGDPNFGNNLTIDGDDEEQLIISDLSISNFVAGSEGLTVADITNLQFSSLSFFNGTAANDGVAISTTAFDINSLAGTTIITQPTDVDLSAVTGIATSDVIFIQSDTLQSNNRVSLSDVTVSFDDPSVVPEPSSTALIALGACGFLIRRKR